MCETGGMTLPDYTIGMAKKTEEAPRVEYAFLPMNEVVEVEMGYVESLYRFYLLLAKNKVIVKAMERDISKEVAKEVRHGKRRMHVVII